MRDSDIIDRAAVVTDVKPVRRVVDAMGPVLPYSVRAFGNSERAKAIDWLSAPPHHKGISHQLRFGGGVLVIQITGPIGAADFEVLSAVIDQELAQRARIHGVVLEIKRAPSWQNVGAFVRHLTFVRSLRGKLDRFAVLFDRRLDWVAMLAARALLGVEARCFERDEIRHALDWVTRANRDASPQTDSGIDRVEQAGIESFPASDPPSFSQVTSVAVKASRNGG